MCAATTRWVRYDTTEIGSASDGDGQGGVGTRASVYGNTDTTDVFTIASNDQLKINVDGYSDTITLTSGVDIDPRYLAWHITDEMRQIGVTQNDDGWKYALCRWEGNHLKNNCFRIYSGTLGTGGSAAIENAASNDARATLGFTSAPQVAGTVGGRDNAGNGFAGNISISGNYRGFQPEEYTVVITSDEQGSERGIGAVVNATSYTGTVSTGGAYVSASSSNYVLTVNVDNGTTMGAGTGNVPTITWTSDVSDPSSEPVELLYPDHWYFIGTKGLMIKFSDAVFGAGTITIPCEATTHCAPGNTVAALTVAQFAYASDRGETGAPTTTLASGVAQDLGTRGVQIAFNGTGNFSPGDTFKVLCQGPPPADYNIESVNFGNVTVSTESEVRCVTFEITAGAYQMSTVKFGLQSHGSFQHHKPDGNEDTLFRFGTVGPGDPADQTGYNFEWTQNIVATDMSDITNDPPDGRLSVTRYNLLVAATADDSTTVSNVGLMSDPIFFSIALGGSETGASTCNYRLFFDYS